MGLYHFLGFALIIFAIGAIGFFVRNNIIVLLMSVELMLNAVNLVFVAFSRYLYGMEGQIYVFFIMAIAAAEVAVGLAIVVSLFRLFGSLDISKMKLLKR
ncbi:MAG: NADH-quinone oxidoreductase subunit NuoK [Deltaproteobacteria bacterium HGW-Deltaproteobacteria-12]|jgi:NADH-quinone oxidoreductase subunit K|nr:MAG: NADH-quinone oxidoreductase subunit NuoK [Deltaproteobacteria bacterium HGW-Deltaproteobacteria-12]